MTTTYVERAIQSMPEEYRVKMANFVLAGYEFHRIIDPLNHHEKWWWVQTDTQVLKRAGTLMTLIDYVDQLPDAAKP